MRLKGAAVILSGIICFWSSGCGMPNRGTRAGEDRLPVSHRSVEARVLKRAFESVALPPSNGSEIRCVVEDEGTARDLLRIIAVESLHAKGYTVVEKDDAVPMFRLSIDSLRVTLTRERNGSGKNGILRSAGARIGVVIEENDGSRRAYRVIGVFEDRFPAYLMSMLDSEDQYVDDLSSRRDIYSLFKPVAVGVTMTVITWLLYSYRG